MTAGEYNSCVERFSDGVYRFILKSLRDSETARDIVQETFLRLWENRSKIIAGKEKSYLFTVAYRLMIDHIRYNKRYAEEERIHSARSENGSAYTNLREILSAALDRLPELQKNLILLRDYEGYSYKEIGEITGLSESQVKVYIFRGRVTLKEKLGKVENII